MRRFQTHFTSAVLFKGIIVELNTFKTWRFEVEFVKRCNKTVQCFKFTSQRVRDGVPYGFILGPLLLLSNLKGLPTAVSGNGKVHLFADDKLTSLIITEDGLEPTCTIFLFISLSSLARHLKVNFQKAQFMQCFTKRATAGRSN